MHEGKQLNFEIQVVYTIIIENYFNNLNLFNIDHGVF